MNELSQHDAGHQLTAARTSIRAKLFTLPRADHNGRYEVDESALRYPCGLVDPAGTGVDR